MIQIPLYPVLTSLISVITSFWLWMDNIVLVPEFGDGVTLLELYIGFVCLDVILFLVFGFLGWNDGGGED